MAFSPRARTHRTGRVQRCRGIFKIITTRTSILYRTVAWERWVGFDLNNCGLTKYSEFNVHFLTFYCTDRCRKWAVLLSDVLLLASVWDWTNRELMASLCAHRPNRSFCYAKNVNPGLSFHCLSYCTVILCKTFFVRFRTFSHSGIGHRSEHAWLQSPVCLISVNTSVQRSPCVPRSAWKGVLGHSSCLLMHSPDVVWKQLCWGMNPPFPNKEVDSCVYYSTLVFKPKWLHTVNVDVGRRRDGHCLCG